MGILDLFRREPTGDESLVKLATAQGWPARAVAAPAMLPPSHVAADIHGLRDARTPDCFGRAFAIHLGPHQTEALISHAMVVISDDNEHVIDQISWPVANPFRFEAELGAAAWQHHRLGQRFGPAGYRSEHLAQGPELRLSRAMPEGQARALLQHPGWSSLWALREGPLRGFCAECMDGRAAVFVHAGMSRRGVARWEDLLKAAQTLEAILADAGAPGIG